MLLDLVLAGVLSLSTLCSRNATMAVAMLLLVTASSLLVLRASAQVMDPQACELKLLAAATYTNEKVEEPLLVTCCGPLKEAVQIVRPCLCELYALLKIIMAFCINFFGSLWLSKRFNISEDAINYHSFFCGSIQIGPCKIFPMVRLSYRFLCAFHIEILWAAGFKGEHHRTHKFRIECGAAHAEGGSGLHLHFSTYHVTIVGDVRPDGIEVHAQVLVEHVKLRKLWIVWLLFSSQKIIAYCTVQSQSQDCLKSCGCTMFLFDFGGNSRFSEQDRLLMSLKGHIFISSKGHIFMSSKGTWFYLPDDHVVEDAVPLPFRLCHQRWTTTPQLLIPRFNGGDPLRLSLVMVLQNLQLSPSKPRVHTPDRPLGEPPAGHQLVWSTMEALKDCRCNNIESVLSTDDRSLFGFICNLWYQLQVFRSSFFHFVHLGTCDPCSTLRHRHMLYPEL